MPASAFGAGPAGAPRKPPAVLAGALVALIATSLVAIQLSNFSASVGVSVSRGLGQRGVTSRQDPGHNGPQEKRGEGAQVTSQDTPRAGTEAGEEASSAGPTGDALRVDAISETDLYYDARIPPFPPKRADTRVAVCLVGAARDFELTGPSILFRVLTAYPGAHLFVHTPLDEDAFKLHALAWAAPNVTVATVRIFPNWWVDEMAYPRGVVQDPMSPQGTQGMFQYFRLVEGCVDMIGAFERTHDFRFNWLVRTRVDTFWAKPPPPLEELNPEAYTIPFGTDCLGLNDRLGVGTWATSRAALLRLRLLHDIGKRANLRQLNSEGAFQAQMLVTNTSVARHHFWFCVVSRRRYLRDMMPVAGLDSKAALNGAKCQPCTPWLQGPRAEKRLQRYAAAAQLGPVRKGVQLCNSQVPWEPHWPTLFDNTVGPTLASMRRQIASAPLYNCIAVFQQLQLRTKTWDSLTPEALCLRRELGRVHTLGTPRHSFGTFLGILQGNASDRVVVVRSTPLLSGSRGHKSWEEELRRELEKHGQALQVVTVPWPKLGASKEAVHVLKVTISRGDLFTMLGKWMEQGRAPAACQLIVTFVPGKRGKESGGFFSRNQASEYLSKLHYELNSCVKEPGARDERCLYFSTLHCPALLGIGSLLRKVQETF